MARIKKNSSLFWASLWKLHGFGTCADVKHWTVAGVLSLSMRVRWMLCTGGIQEGVEAEASGEIYSTANPLARLIGMG